MSKLTENAPMPLLAVTVAWAGLTLIHFTIWSLACIISGHLQQPWWLWVGAPGGVLIGAGWAWWREAQHRAGGES